MKRLLAFFLCMLLVLSMTACGSESSSETKKDTTESESGSKTEENVETPPSEEPEAEGTGNMIANGDFSAGTENWALYTNGGMAEMTVNEEGQLQVDISSLGTVEHGVQIYYDGFALDTGCVYKLSFDISSTAEAAAEWRLQINGGDYHPYVSEYITMTPENLHVECEFTMEEGSDPAPRLCVNMGKIEGFEDPGVHTVYADNFELLLLDDSNKVQPAPPIETPDINLNQVGYRPGDTKTAVFRGDAIDTEFNVVEVSTGEVVYTGTVSEAVDNPNAGERNGVGDFSEVTKEGTYKLVGEKCKESYEFVIAENVYEDLLKDVVRMFYLQRCGTELTEDLAGDFKHAECHTTEAVIYGTEETKEVNGGWHDAGDYGKYVVPGAKAVMDLLLAYEAAPDVFTDDYEIPESGNGIADILDECRYELEWMLKMQDEKTGGVYHKVTCANFPEEVLPEEETAQLILAPMSTAATGDFAAVMAKASMVYGDIDAEFAQTCLKAAKKAYEYLEETVSGSGYRNPDDIVTGEYPDGRDVDERFFAACELYKATGDKKYHKAIKETTFITLPRGLGWASVGMYGIVEYLSLEDKDEEVAEVLTQMLKEQAEKAEEEAASDGYSCTLGDTYPWGSNMSVANNGMLLLFASDLVGTDTAGLAGLQLDYILGRNANSYCFVTGYGSLSPENPHHRPSMVAGSAMKGMLIGGPDNALEDPYAKAVLAENAPAKCYADNSQSFSCNEITIYWNSPLVYLIAKIVAN